MRYEIITIMTVLLCGLSFFPSPAQALTGSGTEEEPWRIQSLEDFKDFAAGAKYWAGFTRLETDVNLAGMVYERAVIAWDVNNSNSEFDGIAFAGVFDGNDHKIMNLTIDRRNYYLGLFGYIDDGEIRNLGIEGSSVSGKHYVGSLVGTNLGSVSNCYCNGNVDGYYYVGGLVGTNSGTATNCYSKSYVSGNSYIGCLVGGNHASVTNCYSTGSASGVSYVGGLVGVNVYATVSNSYFNGEVSGGIYVGGIVGYNWESLVLECYSTGDVSGYERVGNLLGLNTGSVLNCYSKGSVSGEKIVGGLVGNNNGSITNCYSVTDVNGTGNSVGGLLGTNWRSVSNCFWDIDINPDLNGIGNTNDPNVIGLPTTEMQTGSTFTDADWDFINVWNIGENQTYPYLRIYLAGDINKDGIVNFLDIAITANQWMEQE